VCKQIRETPQQSPRSAGWSWNAVRENTVGLAGAGASGWNGVRGNYCSAGGE